MALLADTLVVIHLLYIFFVVGGESAIIAGGIRGWPWVRNLPFRVAHLCAIALVAAEVAREAWQGLRWLTSQLKVLFVQIRLNQGYGRRRHKARI